MEVSYIPSSSGYSQQYGRSPHDLQDNTGHSSDRSRNSSTSFDHLTDLSPNSVPMQFNLSDGASSDNSWPLTIFDSDPTSPMSNNLVDQDLYGFWPPNTSQPLQGSTSAFAQQTIASAGASFGHQSQQFQSSRFGHLCKTS